MTNPPQEPGESSPEPEESGEATSEQESASDPETTDAADADTADAADAAKPDAESDSESAAESDSESDAEVTAVDAAPVGPPPADQPPTKSRKGRIAAIVLVVALVLAGGGVAVYLVTRADQGNSTADRAGSGASSTRTTKSSESSESESADPYDDYYDDYTDGSSTDSSDGSDYPEYDDYEDYGETSGEDEPEREIRDIDDGSVTSDDPDEVRLAYMAAYENKEFSDIVENSCTAYQERFGTDTQELEDALADFDVFATEDGDLDVDGRTATGRIDIELSSDDNTDSRKILVKLVEERGKWRFCGEDEA